MAKENKLKTYPDRSLTTPTQKWDFSNSKESLLEIISLLDGELKNHPEGVAIAANQMGLKERIFVIEEKTAAKWDIPRVIINPRLKDIPEHPKREESEGCLSFPGIFVKIKRYDLVTCDYDDVDGIKKVIILDEFPARIFQHECDHLDGKLIIDRLPRIQKYQVIGEMKKRKG